MQHFVCLGTIAVVLACGAACGSSRPGSPASNGGGTGNSAGNASAAGQTSEPVAAGSAGTAHGGSESAAGSSNLPSEVECDRTPWPSAAPALEAGKWTAINPGAESDGPTFAGEPNSGAFVQGLAIDPCNTNTIYLTVQTFVGGGGGLYKTLDAGANWTRIGHLDEPIRVRVDPRDPLHLYAGDGVRGATMGFWVSHDGGNTWTMPEGFKALVPREITNQDLYDVAVDPGNFDHVLLTYHSEWGGKYGTASGVLESTDAGDSWKPSTPDPSWGAGNNVWFMDDSATWLLGSQSAGYWRTTDSGESWIQVSKCPMTHGGGQLYKAGKAWYSSCNNGVQRSTDDGATWTSVLDLFPTTSVYGDGTTLYTHSAYLSGEGPFYTSAEADGVNWAPFGEQKLSDGPFEMALDTKEHILYSANWGNGLLAMKVP